jgi:O-antigen ligase
LILAIFQTGSRGGLLVLVSGIMGLVVCGAKATRTKRAGIAVAAALLLGAMILREVQHGTVAASRLSKSWNEGDTAGRTEIYDVAWPMFLERPLLGYGGANNYFTLGRRLHYANGSLYYRDTHNLYLAVLTEVGLVGAVPFLLALFYGAWTAWLYGRRTGDARPFALMCALVTINSSLTAHQEKVFWIVLAVAVACGSERIAEQKIHAAGIWPQSANR